MKEHTSIENRNRCIFIQIIQHMNQLNVCNDVVPCLLEMASKSLAEPMGAPTEEEIHDDLPGGYRFLVFRVPSYQGTQMIILLECKVIRSARKHHISFKLAFSTMVKIHVP